MTKRHIKRITCAFCEGTGEIVAAGRLLAARSYDPPAAGTPADAAPRLPCPACGGRGMRPLVIGLAEPASPAHPAPKRIHVYGRRKESI